MKKLGLIGKDISYSLSPLIHNELLKIYNIQGSYSLLEFDNIDNISKDNLLSYNGLNITIPYKEQIVNFVDKLQGDAIDLKLINTISYDENNNILGHNTDILGFDRFFQNNIENINKVGILANSATAKMLKYYFMKYHGIEPLIFSSKQTKDTLLYEKITSYKIDFLINTSPLGQGQYLNKSLLKKEELKQINPKYVLDFNYNPYNTKILKSAKQLGIKNFNGLEILVNQAIYSFEIWNNVKVKDASFKKIKKIIENNFVNNHLIYGMPLSGKSTLYKNVIKGEKILDFNFDDFLIIDLDEYVTNELILKHSPYKSIKTYVDNNGINKFRELEYIAIKQLLINDNKKLIFLGGGTLVNDLVINLLDNCILYYLEVSFEKLIKRLLSEKNNTRPLLDTNGESQLLDKYKMLYKNRITQYGNIFDYKI